MTTSDNNPLSCDMTAQCGSPVAYIDQDGYVYCEAHGLQRRCYQPCRKLRPAELKRLLRGEKITRY